MPLFTCSAPPIDLRRPENIRLLQPRHLKSLGSTPQHAPRAVNLDVLSTQPGRG